MDFLYLILGLIILVVGAEVVIRGSVSFGKKLNISLFAIGVVIVAGGTSLPELATTFAAVMRRQSEVVLGNIIGSNLFNILFIVGIASLIEPMKFQEVDAVQSLSYLIVSVILFLAIVVKPRIISRAWGFVFLIVYSTYIWFLIY